MIKTIFKCETITPMFLAGADGSTAELRPPSIKGLLRFWWRAVQGNTDIGVLKEKETEIFGGVGKNGRKSKFNIRIESDFEPTWQELPKHTTMVSVKGKSIPINIMDYLAFGPVQRDKQLKKNVLTRPYFSPESKFSVHFNFTNPELIGLIKDVFHISAAFGGLGAKTRNGFGCFKILSDDLGVVEQIDYSTYFSNVTLNELPRYSAFSDQIKILQTAEVFEKWDDALAQLGKIYRYARTTIETPHHYDKRKYLAAPLMVNNINRSILERLAKPFFLHVEEAVKGQFRGYIFYIPSHFCYGLEKDIHKNPIDHSEVDKKFSDSCMEFIHLLKEMKMEEVL